MIAIGERVKEVRKALKFQQKEMAAGLKMSVSYLSEIESAHAKPGPEFFITFSGTYNVSLEYLLLGRGDMLCDRSISLRQIRMVAWSSPASSLTPQRKSIA